MDGSAQLPTAHHSPVRNLLVSHQNLVEPCSDVVWMMWKFGFSSFGDASIEGFSLREQSRPQHRYPNFCLIAVEVPRGSPLAGSVISDTSCECH